MNEKLEKIVNPIKEGMNALLAPLLGSVCLGREKRLSVELTEEKITICEVDPKKKLIKQIIEEEFLFYNKETKFEKDYIKFSEQISEIVKKKSLKEEK